MKDCDTRHAQLTVERDDGLNEADEHSGADPDHKLSSADSVDERHSDELGEQ